MAVRSIDPHWAAMAGYRVGEMYRMLHRDLMQIPPPSRSKTEKQKQMFFAFMHIATASCSRRGCGSSSRPSPSASAPADSSPWIQRARDARERDAHGASRTRRRRSTKMPFTEDEVRAALGLLQKKTGRTPRRRRTDGLSA